ncbi:adenosylhomocysteinase [Candidatus Micrarchaeota archaeon]|nr:adenosylhomocysteinase [Candidatus Micrarchaeota archaeon]MBD3418395.1 adenosylhomocysteinase [Candidatus Micrarchaeota archaeon]
MDKGENYEVRDLSLAEQGKKNIQWAMQHMPIMKKIQSRFEAEKPFEGLNIGLALHVTKETAVLLHALRAGGAKVTIAGCNPLSTQDDVAAALVEDGFSVYAYKGETTDDYYRYIEAVLAQKPNLTIDDGGDLVTMIHTKKPELIESTIGGCEETTTGVIRLRAMEADGVLKYPVVAVNDNKTKHLLDNYYGTGQSTLDGILRSTNILFAGKILVVCGYGDCGKGVALKAAGLGANIVVTEVHPFRALQAYYDGYRVMPIEEAARIGDVFVTVTGDKNVIDIQHMKRMKDGAVLANAGHFDAEINVSALRENADSMREMRPFLEEFVLEGKKIFLCAGGRLVNLGAAEGHPSEVMATSFAGQSLACEYLVKNKGELGAKVISLPEKIDDEIAGLQLDALGVKMDTLTAEQEKYLHSWQEGTE